MDLISNAFLKRVMELVGRYRRYSFAVLVFLLAFFYNSVVVVKEEVTQPNSLSINQKNQKVWDMTSENPAKAFSDVFHGKSDDWYRVGVYTTADEEAYVDVYLQRFSYGDVLVGSFRVSKSEAAQYHEIVFSVPFDMYSDVKFLLRPYNQHDAMKSSGVMLSRFFISRLNVKNKFEAEKLTSTEVVSDGHPSALLAGSRIEDLGKETIYSYFFNEDASDFSDVFYTQGNVWFDEKKKRVVAGQQNDTVFVYRFFTKYPFEKFSLSARSIGSASKEVGLEYSFDNKTWIKIPEREKGIRDLNYFHSFSRAPINKIQCT